MSLELKSAEVTAIDQLYNAYVSSSETELEATFPRLDYTNFLNTIKYLRSIGLTESPQPPKLNILVPGGLRFTLVGNGVIENYCNDNTLKAKPFHVIIKEKKATIGGISEIDLNDYDVRIKVRRELPLEVTDTRVIEALAKWATLPKSFRYIRRYTFTSTHHGGIQFDASFVHENAKDKRGNYIQSTTFLGAEIHKQPIHYEIEVEALGGSTKKSLLIGIAVVLRGLQRSYVLTRNSVKRSVLELLAAQTGSVKGFPGSQPVTLRKAHIGVEPEPDTPSIRTGDYNVTDKADGLRCLLVVARNGRMYLVDRNLNVYGTDRRLDASLTEEWGGTVLDGEWVTQDANNKPYSRYYAFDIFNGKRGEDVSGRPFLVRSDIAVSRLAALTEAIAILNNAGKTVSDIPVKYSLTLMMKTFQTPIDTSDTTAIFKVAADVLDRLKHDAPYHTDGLIFTPNNLPLAKNVNTWPMQFKWKPSSMNSVDFLVITEKERNSEGKPTNNELIGTKLNEDTQQIVRYKTLRLFVGSSTDPAFTDPRMTVLEKKPFPSSDRETTYRPVEFAPQPPDPMASVCYVALNAGATDAAGAAPAAQAYAALDDNMYTTEGDVIQNRSIVEMSYDVSRPSGWRWIPMRVRWDKTEQFQRGILGGTLNADKVANDVWNSIHDPITETMIRTGAITEEVVEEGSVAGQITYYQRRASQRDLYKIRGLQEFHNRYIKDDILLRRTIKAGGALIDLSCGQAGDIHKWLRGKVGWVLGIDIALSGLVDNINGAYRRYLDQMIKLKGSIPRMLFIHADSSLRLSDGSAGLSQSERNALRTLWGEKVEGVPPAVTDLLGVAASGFDTATAMFSLHYFFKDKGTLDGFLQNLSDTVKVDGYFVGCCFDGETVDTLLRDLPMGGVKHGVEDNTDIWTITKKYSEPLSTNETGLGRAIDVGFISIGEMYTEYLVSFPYLTQRLQEIGFELLNNEELASLGLVNSTNLFSESHAMAAGLGRNFAMSTTVKQFSFLNRWFIFKRRTANLSVRPETAPVLLPTLVVNPEAPTLDLVVPEGNSVEDSNLGLVSADGPAFQFYHKSAPKDDLKIGDKYWRRYLSTYAPFEFKDPANPSIKYVSLEAALGAAKFAIATNKPELGQSIFSIVGNIHQRIEQRKVALGRDLSTEESTMFIEEEGNAYKEAQKTAGFRKAGATFVAEAWEAAEERILAEFLRQRYEGDAHFRDILNAVAAIRGKLVYYTNSSATLGGSIKTDGTVEGANRYGRALMRLVGLQY
jgi:hypothetical protein